MDPLEPPADPLYPLGHEAAVQGGALVLPRRAPPTPGRTRRRWRRFVADCRQSAGHVRLAVVEAVVERRRSVAIAALVAALVALIYSAANSSVEGAHRLFTMRLGAADIPSASVGAARHDRPPWGRAGFVARHRQARSSVSHGKKRSTTPHLEVPYGPPYPVLGVCGTAAAAAVAAAAAAAAG